MPSGRVFVTLLRLLVFPELFFDGRTPRLGVVGRVVAAVAILQGALTVGLAGLVALRLAMVSDTTDLAGAFDLVGTPTLGDAVAVALLVVLNWLVVGLSLHVVAWLFDSDGSVRETLYVVGWSSPVALLSPLFAGVVIALSRPESRPWDGAGDQLGVLVGNAVGVGILAGIVVLCWQGYIWIAGLDATHGIGRETASKASVVTVVLVGLLGLLVVAS